MPVNSIKAFLNIISNNYRARSIMSMVVIIKGDVTRNSQRRFLAKHGFGIGNSMIFSDIWHKYHEWYFEIVIRNLRQFWNIPSGIYAKYHVQIMLLFFYTTTRTRFVIFTCRYFKLSWNNTALSQSNCRNFSCSGTMLILMVATLIAKQYVYGLCLCSMKRHQLLFFILKIPKNVISLSEYPVLYFLIVAKYKNKIIYTNWTYAYTICFLYS